MVSFTLDLGDRIPLPIHELQRRVGIKDVSIHVQALKKNAVLFHLKTSVKHERNVIEAILRIHEVYELVPSSDFSCRSNFDIRPALLQNSYGLFHLNTIRWIAFHTNTQMQFSPQDTSILISGAPQCVFLARKFLTVYFLLRCFGAQK